VWGDPQRAQLQLLQPEPLAEEQPDEGDAGGSSSGGSRRELTSSGSVTIEWGNGNASEQEATEQGRGAGDNSVLVAATACLLPLPASGDEGRVCTTPSQPSVLCKCGRPGQCRS
jgi:hypothetical protein